MKKYQPPRKKNIKGTVVLTTTIVKNLVEFEFGPIPLEALVQELALLLDDWIDEVISEQELAYKISVGDLSYD